MARKLKYVSRVKLAALMEVRDKLRQQRGILKELSVKQGAARLSFALRSIDGAIRHAERCYRASGSY